jgi:hypothetical protein
MSPLRLEDSFSGYGVLGWLSFSLKSPIYCSMLFWLLGLCWEVWGDSYGFIFVYKLAFFFCSYQYPFFFPSFDILIMMWNGIFLFWSCLLGVWNLPCTWVSILLHKLGKFSPMISLNRFSMLLVYISAPSSTLRILRFGLLILSQSSFLLYSCVFIFSFVIVCGQ